MKKMSNKHWFNFSNQKMKHFSKMGYTNCPHAGKKSLIIMELYYSIKFIDGKKNLYFVLFQKRTELSGSPFIIVTKDPKCETVTLK